MLRARGCLLCWWQLSLLVLVAKARKAWPAALASCSAHRSWYCTLCIHATTLPRSACFASSLRDVSCADTGMRTYCTSTLSCLVCFAYLAQPSFHLAGLFSSNLPAILRSALRQACVAAWMAGQAPGHAVGRLGRSAWQQSGSRRGCVTPPAGQALYELRIATSCSEPAQRAQRDKATTHAVTRQCGQRSCLQPWRKRARAPQLEQRASMASKQPSGLVSQRWSEYSSGRTAWKAWWGLRSTPDRRSRACARVTHGRPTAVSE